MSGKFGYCFRKHPLVRVLCLVFAAAAVAAAIILATMASKEKPVLSSLSPQIGVPGDIMVVSGSGFGGTRDTSYVEIGGSSIVSSLYLSWTDTQIKLLVPSDVQDGLVYVVTRYGRSEPMIFANRESVPVAVREERRSALPVILSVSPQSLSVGQVLRITGENFGSMRNSSAVYFTPQWMEGKTPSHDAESPEQSYVAAFGDDFDYEFWSDTEIRVRVPDSAVSGYAFVHTDKGSSNRSKITVTSPVGTKKLSGKLTYLVELSADISDVQGEADSLITLRIPRPRPSASQPHIQMTECSPPPVFDDLDKSVIHHVQTGALTGTQDKAVFKQNFVIPVYATATNISASRVSGPSEKDRTLYSVYTSADKCVPSDSGQVKELSKEITGKEANPYLRARLIYDFLLDNHTLTDSRAHDDGNPLAMLSSGSGDAYDFSVVFCALARAAGIPCLPVSGILVDSSRNSRNHWWCEFYLERFGWVPVDPALGAGMEFGLFQKPEDRRAFYFGNLDAQHVAFSRGWNNVKPSIVNNKTVYRPRTYALQSIWEESSAGATSYSSFWSDPIVQGIY